MKITTKARRRKTVKLRANGKHKVDAASTLSVPLAFQSQRIVRPQAQFRWLLPNLAAITPQYIEQVLMGALAGNNVQIFELFDLMLKTWPELAQCYSELVQGVMRKKIIFEPYADEDEEPTATAIERMKLVSTALRRMQPDPVRDDADLPGTIEDILDGWFRGISVSEIVWQMLDDNSLGTIAAPKATFWVHPVNYAFDVTGTLGLRPRAQSGPQGGLTGWPFATTTAQPNPADLDPIPPNKFLVSMHKTTAGTVLAGQLLRPLAWWWCAANFSSDWLLNLAQVFGLPFRWANYDANAPQSTIDTLCTMLQNMGSAGWAAFPDPTKLELVQPTGSTGSDHSPQGELLDRADRYARSLILGQTMTGTHGTTGKGGGQAFGMVEADVKSDRIEAAGKFAADIINQQLIPAILLLNYGDTEESPTLRFLEDKEAGLTEAQRDKTLADAGLPIGFDYLRKKYDVPKPGEDEETIGGESPMPKGFNALPGFGQQPNDQQDTETPAEEKTPSEEQDVKAGDAPGHAFRGNQYISLGATVQTPQGQGVVVATEYDHVWVSTEKGIRRWKKTDVKKIPTDNSRFPSITQSGEDQRRKELNAQLANKLQELNAIEDDALFAKELLQLVTAPPQPQPLPEPEPEPDADRDTK